MKLNRDMVLIPRTHREPLSPRGSSGVRTVIRRFSAVPRTHRPDRTWWRIVE